jgi:transcriptional regulator with XRE-family HTH domain
VRVRKLRDEQNFTFDAFVEETGLGRGYISELERGLVVPLLHSLSRLASALEVTVADLVLGPSTREQLFEATRGLPEAEIQHFLQEIRAQQAPLLLAPSVLSEQASSPRKPVATTRYPSVPDRPAASIQEPRKPRPRGG